MHTYMKNIDEEINNTLSEILNKMNIETLEFTINNILKYYKKVKDFNKINQLELKEEININNLFKLLFISQSHLKLNNYIIINKIIELSLPINTFKDTLIDIEDPKKLTPEVTILINFIIQTLESINPNLKFINEFFDYLIQEDIKTFQEIIVLKLSNRNFWGKVPCILNILLSLCHNNYYEFKIIDIISFSKQVINIINNLIKTYPILSSAIEIELIYENEQMGLRQLSISILEKSIEFYKSQYKIKEKDIEHNKNILITISYKLHLICRRLNDTAYFVRLKCISSLIYLLEESNIPLFFINSVNLLVLNKLKDRTILVRRKCVEYLRSAIAKHSFQNDNNVRKATKKYKETYEIPNQQEFDDMEKSIYEIDPTFLEGFFYSQNNMSINEMSDYLEELQDKESINNFLMNEPDKEFYKNSLMFYAHFLYSVISIFDSYMLYILNTNIKQSIANVTINIQDIESWFDILIMIAFYGIDITKYLNNCYLISKEFDKECLSICLKSIGKLIKMLFFELSKRKELINFLNKIEQNLLIELFKYQLIGIETNDIKKEIEINIPILLLNKEEELIETENYISSLFQLCSSLQIELQSSYLSTIMKYLSSSENIIILNFRQTLFRNYISCIEIDRLLIEKLYVLNCKMNYNDLILDSILIERIYKNNNLLNNIDEIISTILQIIANSGNSLKIFSFLGFIIFQHSKYLELISNEMKSNLLKTDKKHKLNFNESSVQKRVYEIFKSFKAPKKYRERRKSLAEERSLLRESFMNSSFTDEIKEEIKEIEGYNFEITENDIDDAIFYLKDHEILYKGCLSRIYNQLIDYIRINIEEMPNVDWVLLTTSLTTLYKCMCLSTDSFSNNFDIFKTILTTNCELPLDLKHNSLIALHDFFLNYNSFVENLGYIFFKNLYSNLHSETLILIINLSKHGILKISSFWLEFFLSFNFIYYEFINEPENLEEKSMIINFLNSLTENNIILLLYECICGVLFSDISRFTTLILENSNILCKNTKKFEDKNFKLFFIRFILKNCSLILTEKSKISLFLRFLRAQLDDSNISNVFDNELKEIFDLIFKEFMFSEKALNEMITDENYYNWKTENK